jgi:hypothetical protein
MKKFVIASIAAVVATASLATVAEARRHHNDWNDGDDWGSYRCSTIKIIKFTEWGKKVIIINKCR